MSRDRYDFYDFCRTHGLFTCGDCEQYETVADIYSMLDDVYDCEFLPFVYMLWLCSDKEVFTLGRIEHLVVNELM